MTHTRNAALATRLAELGLTEQDLADLLNDATEQATGERGRSTDRYVRMLLEGSIRWPWEVHRYALERVLGRPILELGFIPRGESSAVVSQPPARNRSGAGAPAPEPSGVDTPGAGPDAQHAQEATMDRREVLSIAAGATVSIAVPQLPERGRLGFTDVERLREPLADVVTIDQRLGGVAMAPVCVRQAERVLSAIRHCVASDRVERALYGVAGEYLARAGWSCVDAGELSRAGQHLDRALQMATTAQDPMLQVEINNIMVMRAREAADYPHAQAVAKTSLRIPAARSNPRVAALFHARVAHGCAYQGQFEQTRRALDRARDALDRVTPDTPAPPWLRFFNQSELASLAALSYHVLGRYRLATEQGERSTDTVLPGYVRNRTLYTLWLAEAYLGDREVERAAAQATAGLELARQLRDGLRRGRVACTLRRLRVGFAHWSDVPEARTWIEVYDHAVRPVHRPATEPSHDGPTSRLASTIRQTLGRETAETADQ